MNSSRYVYLCLCCILICLQCFVCMDGVRSDDLRSSGVIHVFENKASQSEKPWTPPFIPRFRSAGRLYKNVDAATQAFVLRPASSWPNVHASLVSRVLPPAAPSGLCLGSGLLPYSNGKVRPIKYAQITTLRHWRGIQDTSRARSKQLRSTRCGLRCA